MNNRLVEVRVDLSAVSPDGIVWTLLEIPLCDDPDKFIDSVCSDIKDYVCTRVECGSPVFGENIIEFLGQKYSVLEKPMSVALDFSVKIDRVEYTTDKNIEHPKVLLDSD